MECQMSRFVVGALLGACLVLSGCGDEDGDGSAPELSDLTYSPMELTTGEATSVTGEFVFYDTDADALYLRLTVEDPNGDRYDGEPQEIDYITDQPDGIIRFSIQMAPTLPGPYSLEIRVEDLAGNVSAPLVAPFEASDP